MGSHNRRIKNLERYLGLKKAGKCPVCGKPHKGKYIKCEKCLIRQRKYSKKNRPKWKKNENKTDIIL